MIEAVNRLVSAKESSRLPCKLRALVLSALWPRCPRSIEPGR
jgi:hypothetical protein